MPSNSLISFPSFGSFVQSLGAPDAHAAEPPTLSRAKLCRPSKDANDPDPYAYPSLKK